jgi:hypothetical protein
MSQKDKKIALTITANTAQLRRDMRRAGGEVKTFERQVTSLGTKLRTMRMRFQRSGIFGRGGGAISTAAGFAGAFGIQQMFAGAKEENAALTDIAITGNLTDKQLQKLRRTMFEVSNATAKSTGELTSFVATVTTMTGDALGASDALAGIGEVMVATGASGEALAGTYVKLTTTMGLLPKQAKEAFNVLRSQEKLGSITMANIAANFGKIIGPAGVFGAEAKGIKGVRTLGGLYQITQRGFGVGQETEAATSTGAFLGFLGRRSKQVKKVFGVDVFNKAGNARDLPTVLEELGKAFASSPEKFRTKGQLIFGRAGVRTAQTLLEAARAPGGFSGKLGSFASANALLRTAGGEDIIGSDAARRRRSASFQFDEQINILKNSFKKHLIPVFKTLASTMKDVGPDLVRTIKFLLENSRGLLKLWLGHKGMTFFKNFMAPLQGGGAAGAVSAVGAMAASGGGGTLMLPNGRTISLGGPAGRANWGRSGSFGGGYNRGFGFAAAAGGVGGGWVNAGRSGGSYYQAGGFGLAGMGGPRVAVGGAWGDRSGRNIGTRWRSRMSNRLSSWYGNNRMAMGRYAGRGASMGGQALGMASMFADAPPGMFRGQGMVENMALMSGNPYAMAAAGASKGATYGRAYGTGTGGTGGNLIKALSGGAAHTGMDVYNRIAGNKEKNSLSVGLGAVTQSAAKLAAMFEKVSRDTPKTLKAYYQGSWRGVEEAKRQDSLMSQWGFGNVINQGRGHVDPATGEWVQDVQAGTYGMTAKGKVALASKLGEGGLKTLSGRLGSEKAQARAQIVRAMRLNKHKGEITEEQISASAGAGRYNKLKDFEATVDRLIRVFQKGWRVNVKTVSGLNPGNRLEENSMGPVDSSGPSAASIYRNPNA